MTFCRYKRQLRENVLHSQFSEQEKRTMEIQKTSLTYEQFAMRIRNMKNEASINLPTDMIYYNCDHCSLRLPFRSDGFCEIASVLNKEIQYFLDGLMENFLKSHYYNGTLCQGVLKIDSTELPQNFVILLPGSDKGYLVDLNICDIVYKPKLIVVTEENIKNAICALYQKDGDASHAYVDFIVSNLKEYLKNETKPNNNAICVFDDASFNQHQQHIERVVGGGRSLKSEKNYVCSWCPESVTKRGQKGIFKERRSYKDHFIKFHHLQEGVQISEFERNVKSEDPKWCCPKCNNLYIPRSSVGHEAVCGASNSSSLETTSKDKLCNISNQKVKKRIKKIDGSLENSLDIDDKQEDHDNYNIISQITIDEVYYVQDSSIDDTGKEEKESVLYSDKTQNDMLHEKKPKMHESGIRQLTFMQKTLTEDIDYMKVKDGLEEKDNNIAANQAEKSFVKEQDNHSTYIFGDVKDEFCSDLSYEDTEATATFSSIEKKSLKITDIRKDKTEFELHKWWKHAEFEHYKAKDVASPNFFFDSDSKEFIETCTNRFHDHQHRKTLLDQQMIDAESDEARLLQFSEIRDKPFTEKYCAFVSSSSTKDVLRIFSSEFDEIDQTKSTESKTANSYSKRMMEYFRFMSAKYQNFHLDWLLDYKEEIEKTDSNGSSKTFFIPSKEDLTEFLKKYKYGTNPAANCGLRIFAIKKMLQFLIKEVNDNEHCFPGTIVEQRKMVEAIVHRLNGLNATILPAGTIKHLSTASNNNHRRSLIAQLSRCPDRSIDNIMKGIREYINSNEYINQKTHLIELACNPAKVPTAKEYANATNWLLEQLVCIGGNRPCALLGITVNEWENRKPGYCPFSQTEKNEVVEDDPENDRRCVLKNPFQKPLGEKEESPTGVIVESDTDKIAVGQPCYIWFPNGLVDLINVHSLLAEKLLKDSVDLDHPKTRLFLNSKGNRITKIQCKHFKRFLNLPIKSYDFRKSLVTYCLDSKDQFVRNSESSIVRHSDDTAYAYYYQKHGERVEYVNIQYAESNGLLKPDSDALVRYSDEMKNQCQQKNDTLFERRLLKNIEYEKEQIEKQKQSILEAEERGGRSWILKRDYKNFIDGIEEAIRLEEQNIDMGSKNRPFSNLLNYKPGTDGAGIFPPTHIWKIDMYRVLFGLDGQIGDAMRAADLSVYHGVPFSKGLNGRKKIAKQKEQTSKNVKDDGTIVAEYWRDKIRAEARQKYDGKWEPMRFIFTENELQYHCKLLKSK